MKGLLLAMMPKSKSKGGDAPEDEDEAPKSEAKPTDDDESGGYGDELASILGVSEDDKSDFLSSFAGYVRECAGKKL